MKKNWWSSLRIKIIAWSFVPTVIILSAVAWFTFYSYQKVLGDLIIKQDREILQPTAIQIQQAVSSLVEPIILPIFAEIDKRDEDSLEIRAKNILSQTPGLEIADGGVYFLDRQGVVFTTWPEQPEVIGQDWSDTPHFRFLMDHWNLGAYTDLFSIGSSGEKVICMGIALTNQEMESVGAFYFCFVVYPVTQNAYYQRLTSLNLDPNLFVVDRNHQVIYSPDPSEIGRDLSEETYIQQLSKEENKGGRFRIGTEDKVVSYVPISNLPYQDRMGWVLIREQPWNEIMRPTLPYRQLLLILLATGVIVPVLVTAYGVRHITKPIKKLIQAAEQVTAGQFKQRIEVETGDEIETLADQFNLMSAELNDSYSSLEKKVTDRTRELAILNSIIEVASQSLDIREILEDALSKTVEQMGFEAGAAFKLEPHSNVPRLLAHGGFEPAIAIDLVNSNVVTSQETPAVYPEEVVTLVTTDFQNEELRKQLSELRIKQLVFIPLSAKGCKLGFFILGKHEFSQLASEERLLLTSIGQQVGVAMENARLYEQSEQAATAAERSRLARELHDAVTQTLFSANLIADVIPRIWERSPEEGLQSLEELRQLTHGALAEMRTLLLEMRPESLERADLKSLLTQLVDAFIGRVRVPVSQDLQGSCEPTLEVKLVFYRIVQESLNNIARHSGARHVKLYLDCQPSCLSLCIQDDGLGFDLDSIPPNHLGIAIMRERANSIGATLKIESQPGQGTTIELEWSSTRRD